MKIATTRVNCRGCNTGTIIEFEAPGFFKPAVVPFKCSKCGSKLAAHIKRRLLQNKIDIKVVMVAHTQTLLNILNRRRLNAKGNA